MLVFSGEGYCDSSSNIVLFTAKISKINSINNNSRLSDDGTLLLESDVLNITFKKIRLIHGDVNFRIPSKLTYDLDLSSQFRDLKKKRFSLLIDVSDKENYELLDWSIISSITCFNKKFIDKDSEHRYFKIDLDDADNELCTMIRE